MTERQTERQTERHNAKLRITALGSGFVIAAAIAAGALRSANSTDTVELAPPPASVDVLADRARH